MAQKLYSEEFEKQIISCMLIDNSIIDDVKAILTKECFMMGKLGLYFNQIIKLYEENQSCDMLMLCNSLPTIYAGEIAEISGLACTVQNWDYYARQIKSFYKARELKRFSGQIQEELSESNIDDIIYKTDDFINACMTDISKSQPTNGKDMTIRAIEKMQERIKHPGELTGIDTGYEKLNILTDGFQKGNLIAIGARTSMGKSALSDQLCCNIASKGIQTVTFSLEMTSEEVAERRTSVVSGVPIKKIRSGMLTAAQCQRINQSLGSLFDYGDNLILYDSDSISCEYKDIESKIRIHAKRGAKVFFIDHIGLVECQEMANAPEWERIAYMTKHLKQLANKLKIVIVIVCQLTRDTEGKDPQLNQIRGSGSIEQDCNTVILIHRERQKADEIMIPTKVKVLKCRGGACGDIDFNFYPATTKFEEVVEKSKYEMAPKVEVKKETPKQEEYHEEAALF